MTSPHSGGAAYLIVGRAGMDLAPEPPGTGINEAATFSTSLGGSAANIAVGLSRLGRPADLLSAVSKDAVGDYCLAQLDHYGVGSHYVFRTAGETRTSLALSEARVENHRTIIYRNGAADLAISADHIKAVDLKGHHTLVFTGTAFATDPSRSAMWSLLEKADAHGCRVVLDIDYRPYSWVSAKDAKETLLRAARASSIIAGNEEEFALLADTGEDGFLAAQKLAIEGSGRLALYKKGPDGCVILNGAEPPENIPAFMTDAMKPTGAGDSFLASVLASSDAGHSPSEAVTRGAAAAAMVVARPGCAPAMPDPIEIDTFLKNARNPDS